MPGWQNLYHDIDICIRSCFCQSFVYMAPTRSERDLRLAPHVNVRLAWSTFLPRRPSQGTFIYVFEVLSKLVTAVKTSNSSLQSSESQDRTG